MQTLTLPLSDEIESFIVDYADGTLDKAEFSAFNDYMNVYQEEGQFAKKARKGRQALRKAKTVKAASGFEERLFNRIALEESCMSADLIY